jgi:predicted nucleic acid-binding protein
VRILVDTNVLLDIALKRDGLFEGSARALAKCGVEYHDVHITWPTFSNLFYILRRDRGVEKAVEFLRELLEVSRVASVGHTEAVRAFEYGLADFEDALQRSAAEACEANVILTRNKSDFGSPSRILLLTPEEFAPIPSGQSQSH